MKTLNLLFIGNSHTYYNDMPLLVKRRAEEAGLFLPGHHDRPRRMVPRPAR